MKSKYRRKRIEQTEVVVVMPCKRYIEDILNILIFNNILENFKALKTSLCNVTDNNSSTHFY
jgi:hypothetical protein